MDRRRLEIAIALVWKGPELLVTKRPAGAHLAGFWEFPGGKREPDERFEDCAVREVREEVGLVCRATALRAPLTHRYADRDVTLVPVDCEWQEGDPVCVEVAEWAWVLPSELCRYTFPEANAPLIASLAQTKNR
jgi:mutator protein MutT